MPRARKTADDPPPPPESLAALDRVLALAKRMAADVTGTALPLGSGTPVANGLAIAMTMFLFKVGPETLNALFFIDGSLKDVKFAPYSSRHKVEPFLADLAWMPEVMAAVDKALKA